MGRGLRGDLARQLQGLLDVGAMGSLEDGELLARFLKRDASSEGAFRALVDRHGRMVLRISRDVLGDSHEAQDAAQATFFILARKAGSIRKPEALASWLHGTARRVASRALRESIRRRRHERRSAEASVLVAEEAPRSWSELHEELSRLPDRYREPIILCDLTGLTHEQAAGKLGCPARTLETRLYRGREQLKGRLIRRGLAPASALVGMAWSSESQAMTVSWVEATASAGTQLIKTGAWAAVGTVSANSVGLARSYLREITMFKLKIVLISGLILGLAWHHGTSQVLAQKEQVRSKAAPEAVQEVAEVDLEQAAPKTYTSPITVTGRAVDPEGKPIAGARVYLGSRLADYKPLVEGKTDAAGRYEFQNVPLPIEKADTVNGRDQGAFQVVGEAAGFGFTFRSTKTYYPLPASKKTADVVNPIDPPYAFEAGEKINIDLQFPPAASLHGTIIDDRGNPLPNISLRVRDCEVGVKLDDNRLWSFDSYIDGDFAPTAMKRRTTDALGHFEFTGLPADCRFRIMVDAKGFPSYTILAATAAKADRYLYGEPAQTGELKLTMPIPMDVPVKMIYADTGEPAPGVAVQTGGLLETSDQQGKATLRLSHGTFQMQNWPARGTPYLISRSEIVVGVKPPVEPFVLSMRRAGELEITVVDEATGQGLPGVDVWQKTDDDPREKYVMKSWEVATRISHRDSPRTDAQGKLKVFVEPGGHRFGVAKDACPLGYEVVEANGQDVECRAGVTSTLKFLMRKPKPKIPPAVRKEDAKPQDAFEKAYTLADGEDVKALFGQALEARNEHYRGKWSQLGFSGDPTQGASRTAFFRWQDGARRWFMTTSGSEEGVELRALIHPILGVREQEAEGDLALLATPIRADFLIREGVSAEKLVPQLETILKRDLGVKIRLTLKDERRGVVVVRGKYQHKLIPNLSPLLPQLSSGGDRIVVYARNLGDPFDFRRSRISTNNDFAAFLSDLSGFIGRRVVDEVRVRPERSFDVQITDFRVQKADKPEDRELVLQHLNEQTGLTFFEEPRPIRVFRIERAE